MFVFKKLTEMVHKVQMLIEREVKYLSDARELVRFLFNSCLFVIQIVS